MYEYDAKEHELFRSDRAEERAKQKEEKRDNRHERVSVKEKLAEKKGFDAIVALGAVVQGATAHAELINETTARAFNEISLATGVPVLDGVVSAENLEQAVERCGTKQGNKGFSAMQGAIEMANLLKQF